MSEITDRLSTALADRYRVERELGAGGMATVYLAEDLKHHRRVAVKVLRSDIAQTLGADRFVREIEIAAQLHHPHILPLLDSGEADGLLFYVMPYVEGESLRAKLDRERELPVPETIKILHEVVDGLAKAHGRGVVHRDIKPDNILLSDGHAAIADFGVAKALSEATGSGKITTVGIALGTPAYMAPEQAAAAPHVDHRADLYAVGVMAYEMLAGRPPFEGGTPQAVLAAHVTQTPEAVTAHREAVPPVLATLVMKCLEKKPADRWQSAEVLRAELEKLATPSGGTSPVGAVTPSRTRWKMPVAAAAVAVIGVAGALWLGRDTSSDVVVSAERVAVIPFAPTTSDSSLFRLGRDMVVLLSRNLDGVGDIAMVDASTVLARVTEGDRGLSLEEAAEHARGLGAGSFVHGRFVRAGDDIILDVTLNESADGREMGRASARAREDDIVALTDSVTWSLLTTLWRGPDAPTPSIGAVTTRSLEALRAFLDGEQAVAHGEWFRAPELFRAAFEADTSFLLPYFRYWDSRSWMSQPTDTAIVNRVRRDRHLLPERERLLADAKLAPNLEARLAIGRELTDRFPDYWPGWLEYGDRLVHYAGYLGYEIAEARPAFERITMLNPNFQPAWEHLVYVALGVWDADAASRDLDHLETLARGDATWYDDEFFQTMRLSVEALSGSFDLSDAQVDSLARAGLEFGRETNDPSLAVFFAPDAKSSIAVSRRIRQITSRPEEIRVARIQEVRDLASTGAWAAALDEADRLVADDPFSGARLTAYRVAALGRWLEALPAGVLADRDPKELLDDPDVPLLVKAELAWWRGAIALGEGDEAGIDRAREMLAAYDVWSRAYLDSSLAAYSLALSGHELEAARIISGLELDAENLTWGRGARYTAMVNRLAAASWLTAAGAFDDADRILRHTEAVMPDAGAWGAMEQVYAVSTLQRARAAEAAGRSQVAADFYNRFLVSYPDPDPSHQHLRDEAEAALVRLTAERN